MPDPIKVAYIEGRPHGHPTHSACARAVSADFYFVDHRLRYHDLPGATKLRRYTSWLLSAIGFPKRRSYDVFLSEEAYFMLGLMKKMGLLSKRQKLMAIMGSHTLYFLHTGRYSQRTTRAFIDLFKLYDAFICEGPLQYELLKGFLGPNSPVKLYQTYNGSPASRFNRLVTVTPNLGNMHMVTIGAIPNQNRIHYKGTDLMLAAFNQVKSRFPGLTFTIVGEYDPKLARDLLQSHCPQWQQDVSFVGQTNDMGAYLKDACLYLHTARGEAWGISVTEAMAAGVPALVSEWTGSKEAVTKVSDTFIVPLEVNAIAEKIAWYLTLPLSQKQAYSEAARQVSKFYTEENAIENFRSVFQQACHDCQVANA
jgi:glycosyltransferase involved in cell wall biosynthesis